MLLDNAVIEVLIPFATKELPKTSNLMGHGKLKGCFDDEEEEDQVVCTITK